MRDVHTRLAFHDGKLYLNLCNDTWDVVEIDVDGWRMVHDSPVCFIRPKGMLPLPRPEEGGTLMDVLRLFGIPEGGDYGKLILGWLIGTLMPNGAYAHLCIHGQQGSAKSTLTKMLRMVVDPNKALSRSLPKEERDLVIAASNSHVVAFENVSKLSEWLSDALCCLSTGAGLSARRLYTDDDEAIFAVKRPIILNGIAAVAVRGDLIDRCIVVNLPSIPDGQRKTEAEVWAAFDQAHARILGALLTAASTALAHWATIRIERLPRLADFALWVEAAAPALGWMPGEFLAAYQGNREAAVITELESSLIVEVLFEYLDVKGSVERVLVGKLLEELQSRLAVRDVQGRNSSPANWPKSPQAFRAELERLTPALAMQGIQVEFHKHTKKGTPVSIFKQE